jgi:hypothetical protein
MATFNLTDGGDKLVLDDSGLVSKLGVKIGTWTANAANQIVINKTAGGQSTIAVDWAFDVNNHFTAGQGGTQIFDFNAAGPVLPGIRTESAVLFIKPDSEKTFEFSLRPTWSITATHDLEMTVNGRKSVIDGVISDRNGAFRFRFVDKLDVIETFTLLFKGDWQNEPTGDNPGAIVFSYDIAAVDAAHQPTKGTFALPNKLVVDNTFNVLSYSYEKQGRTKSVQLVGQFSLDKFELSYAIERRSSSEGQSTTLKFEVDVTGATASGNVTFALKKTSGAVTSTTFAIGGSYSGKFKNGVLTIGFAFQQQTVAGSTTSRELVFTGELVHQGGTTFNWELALAGGRTTISIAADQIRLGPVTGSSVVKVTLQGGEVRAVQALVGFKF